MLMRRRRWTTGDTLPFKRITEDGMADLGKGVWSFAFSFGDVPFATASVKEQKRIFAAYGDLLNSLDTETSLQVVIADLPVRDRAEAFKKIACRPGKDIPKEVLPDLNRYLSDRMIKARAGLHQEKIFVFTVRAESEAAAREILRSLSERVRSLGARVFPDLQITPLSGTDRLKTLFEICHPDGEGRFENEKDKENAPRFSFGRMLLSGEDEKDSISPSWLSFKNPGRFSIGDAFGCSLYLSGIPAELSSDFLKELTETGCVSLISIHYEAIAQPQALRLIKRRARALDEERAAADGETSFSLQNAREAAADLLNDLINRRQRAFYVTLVMIVFSDTAEGLSSAVKKVQNVSANRLAPMMKLFGRQEEGLLSCLPLGVCAVHEKKLLTTESGSVFLPFTGLTPFHEKGLSYGMDRVTGRQIFYDRREGVNYNALYFGESGTGKSAMLRMELLQVLFKEPDTKITLIDPKGEYLAFAKAAGGEVVTVSAGTDTYLNPLDLDEGLPGEDLLAEKADYLLGLIEVMAKGHVVTPLERSVMDRCVRAVYGRYFHGKQGEESGRPDRKPSFPTLKDLYEALQKSPDEAAEDLAAVLELYVTGSLSLFSKETNIDTRKRFLVYDISRLGPGSRALGLYVCLNDIENRTAGNFREGFWSRAYIDEMQNVLQASSYAGKFLAKFWTMVRARKGIPTGIFQNASDLTETPEGKDILGNTSFIVTMSEKPYDQAVLQDLLHLSETDLSYITSQSPGCGVLSAGGVTVPFDNTVDKRRYPVLYRYITGKGLKEPDR